VRGCLRNAGGCDRQRCIHISGEAMSLSNARKRDTRFCVRQLPVWVCPLDPRNREAKARKSEFVQLARQRALRNCLIPRPFSIFAQGKSSRLAWARQC
jgi:hypothetical protein